MKKVSILLLVDNNHWATRYAYETMMSRVGSIENEVLVCELGDDVRTSEFFLYKEKDEKENVVKKNSDVFITALGEKKETQSLNQLLKQATGEYICIVKPNTLLDDNWLSDLLYFYELIDKSGIVSIHTGKDSIRYSPLLSKGDKLINVMLPDSEVSIVHDLCFFKREFLNHVGCFDEEIMSYDNGLRHLCLRFSALGYDNYYIPTSASIKTFQTDFDERQNKKERDYIQKSMLEMKQRKSYFVPLKNE